MSSDNTSPGWRAKTNFTSTGPDYQIWNMAKIKEMFDTSVPEQFRKYD